MNEVAEVAWNVAAAGLPRKNKHRCQLCHVVLWTDSEKEKGVCCLCEEER